MGWDSLSSDRAAADQGELPGTGWRGDAAPLSRGDTTHPVTLPRKPPAGFSLCKQKEKTMVLLDALHLWGHIRGLWLSSVHTCISLIEVLQESWAVQPATNR